jgi:hypothetical protein
MFLIWTVIAMAFRVSSSGAIELQTATFISTTYLPVSQFWGDIGELLAMPVVVEAVRAPVQVGEARCEAPAFG